MAQRWSSSLKAAILRARLPAPGPSLSSSSLRQWLWVQGLETHATSSVKSRWQCSHGPGACRLQRLFLLLLFLLRIMNHHQLHQWATVPRASSDRPHDRHSRCRCEPSPWLTLSFLLPHLPVVSKGVQHLACQQPVDGDQVHASVRTARGDDREPRPREPNDRPRRAPRLLPGLRGPLPHFPCQPPTHPLLSCFHAFA